MNTPANHPFALAEPASRGARIIPLPTTPRGALSLQSEFGPEIANASGPWTALADMPTPCGAVVIEDANGRIIGWATDAAGHTTEPTPADGRTHAGIALNARVLAEAYEMLAICGEITWAGMAMELAGQPIPPRLRDALDRADQVRRQIYSAERGRS